MKKEKQNFGVFEEAYGYDEELAKGIWLKVRGIDTFLAYSYSSEIVAKITSDREEEELKLGRSFTTEEVEEFGEECFMKYVLLDWKAEGLDCTIENKRIVNEKYPQYFNECMQYSQTNKTFQRKKIEDLAGK